MQGRGQQRLGWNEGAPLIIAQTDTAAGQQAAPPVTIGTSG